MHKIKWFLFAFLAIGVGLYPIMYFILDPMFGLLSTKSSALLADRMYNIGFYTHIIFGGIALLSGWSQFSRKLRARHLPLHRLLGKTYLVSVLLSASAGIYIAFQATGGLVAVTGFLGLGLVWFFSTGKAYASIRKKQIQLHEKWMIYSYAACFAAVTLRLWLPLLTALHAGDFLPAYRIVAWLCWVPNILFAMYLNSKTVKPLASSIATAFLLLLLPACKPAATAPVTTEYRDLVALFKDWRAFETPPLREGAPDYTAATFKKRRPQFETLRARLAAVDTAGWPVPQRVDWLIVWAEMNGYDFNERILQPWARDPAYYKSVWNYRSDVPAHEGPTQHRTTELWTYTFPLTPDERNRLLGDLQVIPPLNAQAKLNLTGNARDLWIAGIRDIRRQSDDLKKILEQLGVAEDSELTSAIEAAIASTDDLATWLEAEAKSKTGPSGIGKDNYSWYLQNVHLVPLTWEDEVMLLKRELARAWASLKLEEHRNRQLPELTDAGSPEAYAALAERSAQSLLRFLDQEEMVTVKDYFEPALREHLGAFVPKERRNFFWITAHYDPRPLYSHFYHWFELAQMDNEPHESEIRRGPLLYNIFDSRNEGVATAVEEMFMQAGLYDDEPRVREIVYIMIAQRAARGLGSLYAHANEMTMEEAGGIHSEYTPRGWMKTEKDLLIFEQHLYLRQPGYGTSYITGKYLMESAMMDYARMMESRNASFRMKDFFDQLNAIGCIPMALGHWEMTGEDGHLREIGAN